MPRQRIGRWTVIAVLDDGRTLTGQNRPRFPQRSIDDTRERETMRLRSKRRRMQDEDIQRENRVIRSVLGVPVR
jgi:hypothetical protein